MKHLKKTVIAFITILALLTGVTGFAKENKTEAASYIPTPPSYSTYKEGDILLTSTTTAFGLTGHTGIVAKGPDGVLYVIHTPGYGKGIEKISLADWWKKYPKTEIQRYRYYKTPVAQKAGERAFKTYLSSKNSITYGLVGQDAQNRKKTNVLYCSKFVWQNYYYGGGVNLGYNPDEKSLITPYSLRSNDMAVALGNSNFKYIYGYING